MSSECERAARTRRQSTPNGTSPCATRTVFTTERRSASFRVSRAAAGDAKITNAQAAKKVKIVVRIRFLIRKLRDSTDSSGQFCKQWVGRHLTCGLSEKNGREHDSAPDELLGIKRLAEPQVGDQRAGDRLEHRDDGRASRRNVPQRA